MELPRLGSTEALGRVLASRVYAETGETGSVALMLVKVPKDMKHEEFSERLKKSLFRASDSVYPLKELECVAVVMDDCKPEAAPLLLKRFSEAVGQPLRAGMAACPYDTAEPEQVFALARSRL
jgi:hypothetical protein